MSGFKSFAEHTVIDFEPGITAIVGPNGSGKSNVTEAIRWVMGEQSAKNLRGEKMNDIIFSGTAKRSPLNIAEVTLVIDNSDSFLPIEYSEVSITRRLTRAGDSDFLINQQSCRLRDIVNLFTDSGLGKHSFAMISQGRVAEIFENKPEERRYLFEEAAGVLKYKQRKQQAANKLDQTEDNLSRIEDILYELKTQIDPLKEQAQTAKRFKEVQDQVQSLDQAILVTEIKDWTKQKQDIQTLVLKQQKQLKQVKEQLQAVEQALVDLKTNEQKQDSQLLDLQKKQVDYIEQVEKIETRLQVFNERMTHSLKTQTDLKQRQLEIKAQQSELVSKKAELINQLAEQKQKLQQAQQKVSSLKQQYQQIKDYQGQTVAEIQASYFDVMQKMAQTKNELNDLEAEFERSRYQIDQQKASLADVSQEEQRLQAMMADLKQQKQQLEQSIAEQTKEHADKTSHLKAVQERLDDKTKQLNKARSLYEKAKIKLDSLKDVQSQYDGYFKGVQTVLKQKNKLSGIIGAVVELIDVPAKYTLAIESALGSAMQNIIVEDEESAKEAIQYLKQHQSGSATFLPINVIKSRYLPSDTLDQCLKMPGFIGVAANLVAHDSQVHNVIQSLLGQTLVVETMDAAIQIARTIRHQYRLVTLEGDIIRPGGAMTGGAMTATKGQLSQKADVQKLAQQVQQMAERVEKESYHQQRLQSEVEDDQAIIAQLEAEIDKAKRQLNIISKEDEVREQQLAELANERKEKVSAQQESQSFIADYEVKKEQLVSALAQYETEAAKQEQALKDQKMDEAERQQKQEQLLLSLSDEEAKQSLLKQEQTYRQQRLVEYEQQQEHLQQQAVKCEEQLAILTEDTATIDVKDLQAKQVQFKQELQVVEQSMADLTQQNEQNQAQQQKYQQEQQALYQAQQDLQSSCQENHIRYEKLKTSLDHHLSFLASEYHQSYEWLEARVATVELTTARTDLKQLKTELASFGPVNLNALTQYEEVNERYQFIKQQHDDLLLAKSQLSETMAEMDQTFKQRFLTTFKQIAAAFATLFPQIFGGGKAQLLLTNPDDLLTTGIDIEAQPPGKKLQSLTLLSGGEQALTAITLLFAILKVKPTSFCVLDEVEAALDEANVSRLSQYLRAFDQETQFIMITHRKGIMEAADTLYGVTMPESGVSKVISVRLEEVEIDEKG